MLIIICETVGCLSQQQGICQITWTSCSALCTVCLIIKHCSCIQSAYCETTLIFTSRTFEKTLIFTVKLTWRNFKFLEKQLALWLAHFYKIIQHMTQQEFTMKTSFVLVLTYFGPVLHINRTDAGIHWVCFFLYFWMDIVLCVLCRLCSCILVV